MLTGIDNQQLLERVRLKQGVSVVLVTPDIAEAVALAEFVVVVREGRITLDIEVRLPRPRRHGTDELARLERTLLDELVSGAGHGL